MLECTFLFEGKGMTKIIETSIGGFRMTVISNPIIRHPGLGKDCTYLWDSSFPLPSTLSCLLDPQKKKEKEHLILFTKSLQQGLFILTHCSFY